MSLKIHFWSPTWIFPQKITAKSVTNKVRLHQDILAMEKRYQGKWTSSILADYYWTLKRDVPEANYRPKSHASTFQK